MNNFSAMSLKCLFLKQLLKIPFMIKNIFYMVDVLFHYLKDLNYMNVNVTIAHLI